MQINLNGKKAYILKIFIDNKYVIEFESDNHFPSYAVGDMIDSHEWGDCVPQPLHTELLKIDAIVHALPFLPTCDINNEKYIYDTSQNEFVTKLYCSIVDNPIEKI